jgi:hypothetical protein
MSTPKIIKKDPTALRYRFNTFLLLRFAMVFAWSMQFIVIEWQVYSITKDPLSLGIRTTNGSYPCCFYGFVCWPHSGSERKESLLVKCILAFQ